jgi:hypothetical protein
MALAGESALRKTALLLFSVVSLSLPAAAATSNNPILGETSMPTPYGLKIVRGIDDSRGEPEVELPIAGLSLGLYLQSVQSAEVGGGVYSPDLVEPLQDIGRAYQAEEKHLQAMDYFRRALHLSRVNEGLNSPNQLPLLTYMIDSHLAMGQLYDVDYKQNYRFRVQQKIYQPGDPAMTEAITEYAEWQRQAYLDGFSGNTYRRVVDMYDVYTRVIAEIEATDPNNAALIPHLYQRMQAEYLLSEYQGEKEPEFQFNVSSSMEAGFALSTDPAIDRFQFLRNFNYRNGLKTLARIVRLEEQQEDPDPMGLARAKIAQGDWYLWWDSRARAIQSYQAAWAILANDGSDLTNPEALFSQPVELPESPVFHPGSITAQAEQRALATVLFNVTRSGQVRKIEIVEQDPPGDMGARVTLFNMMRDMRFRPILREGEVVGADSVVRVYRYDY